MPLNVTLTFPSSHGAAASFVEGYKVRRTALRDAMGELFAFTVELLSPNASIDEASLLGATVVVSMADEPLLPELTGVVASVVQKTMVLDGDSAYELTIAPSAWLLTRRRDHRIFQHLSTPDIVAAVMGSPSYKGRVTAPKRLLARTYEAREYTVQYNETDWQFVQRLLAKDGIACFFEHGEGGALVLIDDTSALAPGGGTVAYVDPSHAGASVFNQNKPHILAAERVTGVEAQTLTIRDYNFEHPELLLEGNHTDDGARAGEVGIATYHAFEVGAFQDETKGALRAQALLEAERALAVVVKARASFALGAGQSLVLVDCPRDDMNGAFLVVRSYAVSTFGEESARVLDLIPLARRYRPRHLPKPQIHGTQTALVVAAAGEEIDVDEHGRVEVEFRWDRRDIHAGGTSRRVRVAHGWANAGMGHVMLPRVNEEVVLTFLDGDPDEPLIVGSLHNGYCPSPLSLPKDKAISVWRSRSTPNSEGYNMIQMDDAAGKEVLSIRAERDYRTHIGHDSFTHVGHDATTTIDGDEKVTVKGNQKSRVHGGSQGHVNGDYVVRAKSIKLDAETTATVEGEKVMLLTTGAQVILSNGTIEIKATSHITLSVGGSSIDITAGAIVLKSDMIKLNP